MRNRRGVLVVVLALGLALQALPAAAQGKTTGSIRGLVTDQQGGVLPGATVIAISDALIGGRLSTITSAEGAYRFPSLPPGMYEIEARLDGFQPVLQQNVQLGLGRNINVDVVLGDVTVSDEIVVMAESSQVSVVSNAADFNMAESFVERQPTFREPDRMIEFAPGVQGAQAYGAPSGNQNAYNMDGVDVSDPDEGFRWVLPSMDWIQEVQIGGLGADAEYGGFTGAVVNMITKSGGNEFHGDLRAYYSGGSLNSDNAPEGVEGSNTVDSWIDVSAGIGGPLVKDAVWYFVSWNGVQEVIEPFYAEGAPSDDRDDQERQENRILGKLTWQINPSNRVLGMVDWDNKEMDYRGVGNTTLASGSQRQDSPNYVYNLSWESLVTDTSFLTAKITGFKGTDDRLPYFGDNPNRLDRESGFDWNNLWRSEFRDVERTALDLAWSLFADGVVTGNDSHNFKFGVNYEQFSSDYVTHRNGGFSYYDDSWYCDSLDEYFADPFCAVFSSDWGGDWDLHTEMDGLHLYAQDAWRVGRLAFNVGVRYTAYTGEFKNSSGTVYDESMWAPRVGLVWDLFGNGRTALKAHFGRYYEGMTATMYDREASGNARANTEYFDYNFDTGEFDIPAGERVNAFATLDPGIEHPSVDQLVLSFEQQIGRELLLGVDYINREYDNINAMVVANLDDYDALVAPDNPFGGNLSFFELLAPQDNLITNPDRATRSYDAVTLRLQKRYSDGWSLDASLVWSDLTGTADWGTNGYDIGFDDLNGFTNAEGTLPGNSEWVFKLSGSLDLPWRLMLSGFYQYQTGEYWTPYAVIEGLYYNDRTPIFLEPRGSQQYDSRQVLDLRLQKEFGLGGDLKLAFFVDAFNLLDSDTVTSVNQQWGWYVYDYRDHPDGSFWDPNSRYLDPGSIQTPRQVRLGARFSW